jgi:hypothetical protein
MPDGWGSERIAASFLNSTHDGVGSGEWRSYCSHNSNVTDGVGSGKAIVAITAMQHGKLSKSM